LKREMFGLPHHASGRTDCLPLSDPSAVSHSRPALHGKVLCSCECGALGMERLLEDRKIVKCWTMGATAVGYGL
jgi:hypothetical protein